MSLPVGGGASSPPVEELSSSHQLQDQRDVRVRLKDLLQLDLTGNHRLSHTNHHTHRGDERTHDVGVRETQQDTDLSANDLLVDLQREEQLAWS